LDAERLGIADVHTTGSWMDTQHFWSRAHDYHKGREVQEILHSSQLRQLSAVGSGSFTRSLCSPIVLLLLKILDVKTFNFIFV